MIRSKLRKSLITIVFLLLSVMLFYKFMTYDRNYTWSKKFEYEVTEALSGTNFKINEVQTIDIDRIRMPFDRKLKIKIQKGLNKVGLMSYGEEFGKQILLTSNSSTQFVNCKGWCLSDHLIGIEIEYKNLDSHSLRLLKQRFEDKFDNYEILWTKK